MTLDSILIEADSLGSYLYSMRTKKNLNIEDIEFDTKIPARILRAMEADDYTSLPAEAFARGFYALYAKSLDLDVEQILNRYSQERGVPQRDYVDNSIVTSEKPVNSLAARPMVSLSSFFGFGLVLIILSFAGLCWYFSWNPATYISKQLRNFQNLPATNENSEEQPEEKASDAKENLNSAVSIATEPGSPLVVMSGNSPRHYTSQGIVFITVPSQETLQN